MWKFLTLAQKKINERNIQKFKFRYNKKKKVSA